MGRPAPAPRRARAGRSPRPEAAIRRSQRAGAQAVAPEGRVLFPRPAIIKPGGHGQDDREGQNESSRTAKITEMPIMEMNSPAVPGIRAIGPKAKIVVSVEASSGPNRVLTALSTASSRSSRGLGAGDNHPPPQWRYRSTGPSADHQPGHRHLVQGLADRLISTITRRTVSGKADPTMSAARQPIIKNSTPKTISAEKPRFCASPARRSTT
jgi:hypothetical protein